MSFINNILKIFVGDKSEKDVKATQPYIAKIKALEPALMALSHDQLRAKTAEFKEKIKLARAKQDAEIAAKKADSPRPRPSSNKRNAPNTKGRNAPSHAKMAR